MRTVVHYTTTSLVDNFSGIGYTFLNEGVPCLGQGQALPLPPMM